MNPPFPSYPFYYCITIKHFSRCYDLDTRWYVFRSRYYAFKIPIALCMMRTAPDMSKTVQILQYPWFCLCWRLWKYMFWLLFIIYMYILHWKLKSSNVNRLMHGANLRIVIGFASFHLKMKHHVTIFSSTIVIDKLNVL